MDPKTAASNMVDTAEQVFRVMRALNDMECLTA